MTDRRGSVTHMSATTYLTRIWPSSPPTTKLHTPNPVSCSTDYSTTSRLPNLLKKILSKLILFAAVTTLLSQNSLLIPRNKVHISLTGFRSLLFMWLRLYHLSDFTDHDQSICLVQLNPLCLISSLLLILSS